MFEKLNGKTWEDVKWLVNHWRPLGIVWRKFLVRQALVNGENKQVKSGRLRNPGMMARKNLQTFKSGEGRRGKSLRLVLRVSKPLPPLSCAFSSLLCVCQPFHQRTFILTVFEEISGWDECVVTSWSSCVALVGAASVFSSCSCIGRPL